MRSTLELPRRLAPALRSRGVRLAARAAALVLLACLAPARSAQDGADPAKALKSKVVAERLAAVEALRASSEPSAEKLLLGALADRDLEVTEKAALALAERGTEASAALLVRECIDAPIRRIRATAARTLAQVAPEKASAELAKLTAGKSAVRALEALAVVARVKADDSVPGAVTRALKSKDFAARLAAVQCLPCLPAAAADAALAELLAGKDAELSAAALDAVAASGAAHFLAPLFEALRKPKVPDVLERRLIGATVACLGACLRTPEPTGNAEAAVRALEGFQPGAEGGAAAEARAMRLYSALQAGADPASPMRALLEPRLASGLASAHAAVRKAALAAVLRRGVASGRDAVFGLAGRDPDAGVRALAVRELARAFGARDENVLTLLQDRLGVDADPRVRETAAVALGVPELSAGAAALAAALGDPHWTVATCAAVSLGKTRDSGARAPLEAQLAHADWRYRASAVVGLTWLWSKDAVPALIRALGDADPYVRHAAHAFLARELKADVPPDRAAWEAWWQENEKRARLVDPEVRKARREKYGNASRAAEVYADLDVVVLESRGDHIERLLERLNIGHRLTQAAKLVEAGLHPGAVYVSNCTGEIEERDVERIAWYVRSGGMLFGSCWSLAETIVRIHPGVLRKFETAGTVLDNVVAEPVDAASPYLKDVFGPDMEPLYHLEGSQLIEVLEPELCEVLIDSPQAEKRWGSGNLAAWFPSGHGVILDSANHFDLQGLEVAPGLKTREDRIAFAFDRLGMDYETWRRTQDEKWWDNALKASQNVFDYSALHFVTNFVRVKRLADG